jgi:hypothetical protein
MAMVHKTACRGYGRRMADSGFKPSKSRIDAHYRTEIRGHLPLAGKMPLSRSATAENGLNLDGHRGGKIQNQLNFSVEI